MRALIIIVVSKKYKYYMFNIYVADDLFTSHRDHPGNANEEL